MNSRPARGLILHDYLQVRGGAERLIITLARHLHNFSLGVSSASKIFVDAGTFTTVYPRYLGCTVAFLPRVLRAILTFTFIREFPQGIDCVIYSGIYAPLAVNRQRQGNRIYYCHTPPRFAFDRQEEYLKRAPAAARPMLRLAVGAYRRAYLRAIRRMDCVIVNSAHAQQLLLEHTGIKAHVVYPPIDTFHFRFLGQRGYYLSVGRLEPNKRIDRIVRAFLSMPGKLLIVASGGTQSRALRAMANEAKNIDFLDWVDDGHLARLVGNAIAVIYVPREEDFGMSAVEAMAAGKPVIGVDEGGLRETIIPGQNGILLARDPRPDHIAEAVIRLTPQLALKMRAACERRAREFSKARFTAAFEQLIEG